MYGMAIDAVPVVVANLIVAGAALYSSCAPRRTDGSSELHEPEAPRTAAGTTIVEDVVCVRMPSW